MKGYHSGNIADNESEIQAKEFLQQSGTKMTISFSETVCGFPFSDDDHYLHDKYIVKLRRNGKSYQFPFYQSAYGTDEEKRPTAYDVLACCEKYEPYGDLWDFADEYGYDIRNRKSYKMVERIFKECNIQYKKLMRLFGPMWMRRLQEIN